VLWDNYLLIAGGLARKLHSNIPPIHLYDPSDRYNTTVRIEYKITLYLLVNERRAIGARDMYLTALTIMSGDK